MPWLLRLSRSFTVVMRSVNVVLSEDTNSGDVENKLLLSVGSISKLKSSLVAVMS